MCNDTALGRIRRSREIHRSDYEALEFAKMRVERCMTAVKLSVEQREKMSSRRRQKKENLIQHTEKVEDHGDAIQEYCNAIQTFMAHSESAVKKKSADIRLIKKQHKELCVEVSGEKCASPAWRERQRRCEVAIEENEAEIAVMKADHEATMDRLTEVVLGHRKYHRETVDQLAKDVL